MGSDLWWKCEGKFLSSLMYVGAEKIVQSEQQRQDELEPEIHPDTSGSIASYSPARGTPRFQSTRAVWPGICKHDRQTWQQPVCSVCSRHPLVHLSYSLSRQYAYHGDDSSRMRPPQPKDEQQSASLRQSRLLDINHGMMAPPPPPGGKRSNGQVHSQTDQRMEISTSQNLGSQRITAISESMGPPPTPQRPFSAALRMPSRIPTQNATASTLQTNRFMPSSSHGRTFSGLTPAVGMTPSGSVGKASGGNRTPFMPQSSNGFG